MDSNIHKNKRNVILKVNKLTKLYKTKDDYFAAVQEASFEIFDRELVCIIGPSGCGKSTLLNMVVGLIEPTSGELYFQGKAVSEPGPERGMVFQAYAAFPWMTVRQNIGFGPKMRGMNPKKVGEIVKKQIEIVGLQGFEDHFPKELSGGMNKRVDLARAYANDPGLLAMDEPFGALDAQTKQKMQVELLRIWNAEEKTVLFVTHDIEEAILLADRIIIMGVRPNVISEIVEVPFPRPRSLEMKLEREFQEMRASLGKAIQK